MTNINDSAGERGIIDAKEITGVDGMSNIFDLYRRFGQSAWLDYIDRTLLLDGGLKALVGEGLRGLTSNPTIFHKAITEGTEYDEVIRDLLQADHEIDENLLYEWIAIADVQIAADILRETWHESRGSDGFVSLEVSPHLANDPEATIEAARRLWRLVDRSNLMIKVPGTGSCLPAIESLIAEGINVNVTLLFSVDRYRRVMEAYRRGLSLNDDPGSVASVASFFVSRIDTKVDARLDEIDTAEARALKGRIAIASARLAYRAFREFVKSDSFEAQRQRGARVQRPLWASTSTKNPSYSDVFYVEQLIGPDTVNTLTPETLEAFQAHGELRETLDSQVRQAERDLESLDRIGVNLAGITHELEREGVRKFIDSHDELLAALKDRRAEVAQRYVGGETRR
ncbi:MAG: transaldolase, partial [Pseudomonadales bacterium]